MEVRVARDGEEEDRRPALSLSLCLESRSLPISLTSLIRPIRQPEARRPATLIRGPGQCKMDTGRRGLTPRRETAGNRPLQPQRSKSRPRDPSESGRAAARQPAEAPSRPCRRPRWSLLAPGWRRRYPSGPLCLGGLSRSRQGAGPALREHARLGLTEHARHPRGGPSPDPGPWSRQARAGSLHRRRDAESRPGCPRALQRRQGPACSIAATRCDGASTWTASGCPGPAVLAGTPRPGSPRAVLRRRGPIGGRAPRVRVLGAAGRPWPSSAPAKLDGEAPGPPRPHSLLLCRLPGLTAGD